MVTSLSPAQLVASKLLNMLALGFTMLVTWIIVGVIAYFIGSNLLNLGWIQIQGLNWRDILVVISLAIPSYVIAAALMFSFGLILGEHQEGESIGPIFFLIAFIPLWFAAPIASDLNGFLAVILSILPITSLMTVGFRTMFMQIPLWQVFAGLVFQIFCVIGAIWLAVRTFQIGMLRYGKRIRLNELFYRKKATLGEEL
jgi:ABC-2 type transport system permease protein